MMSEKCLCQDSNGHVCGRVMTQEEIEDDDMCSSCADNVFIEMCSEKEHLWSNEEK